MKNPVTPLLLIFAIAVFVQSCAKDIDDDPSNPSGKRVASITRTFYDGSKRVKYIRYDMEKNGSRDTIAFKITDSFEASVNHWMYSIARKRYTFDPVTKNISQIVLQTIWDGAWNNTSSAEYKMNFDFNRDGAIYAKMFMTELLGAPITSFTADGGVLPDSGKLYLNFVYQSVGIGGPYSGTETFIDGRFDKVYETGVFRPFLDYYFKFFIPGYSVKEGMNYSVYYNQNKRCDSVLIENGYYMQVPVDPFTWEAVWVGTATIKKHFVYSDDYSILENAVQNLNLMKQSIVLRNAETLHQPNNDVDFYTLNETISKSYTDSCFRVANNQRTFIKSEKYSNAVVKDNTGNIESITQTNSYNNLKVVNSFKYE